MFFIREFAKSTPESILLPFAEQILDLWREATPMSPWPYWGEPGPERQEARLGSASVLYQIFTELCSLPVWSSPSSKNKNNFPLWEHSNSHGKVQEPWKHLEEQDTELVWSKRPHYERFPDDQATLWSQTHSVLWGADGPHNTGPDILSLATPRKFLPILHTSLLVYVLFHMLLLLFHIYEDPLGALGRT